MNSKSTHCLVESEATHFHRLAYEEPKSLPEDRSTESTVNWEAVMPKRGMQYLWRGDRHSRDEWAFWEHIEDYKKTKGLRSLERAALAQLHFPITLNYLAYRVASTYAEARIPVYTAVESVWIDGTPQASGTTVFGKTVNCELADLLYLVDERDLASNLVTRRGLLLQGKLADRHGVLLSGASTTKERNLLESLDTRAALDLYRDTQRKNHIGSYHFKLGALADYTGIEDCARYLIMPKSLSQWRTQRTYSPFAVGWPPQRTKAKLGSIRSLSRVIEDMGFAAIEGKPVIDPSACEWSRMVYDLLAKYEKPPLLPGGVPIPVRHAYAGYRIQRSRRHRSFLAFDSFNGSVGNAYPPFTDLNPELDENEPPGISFIRLTVYGEFDRLRG
ncbi:hypothetical protein [Alcaligenes phenolicus]|uniref:hypothetical protein n=1 Tax=Alcaligenes phenolicus TaxID=232846 RepID=UPI002AA672DA|nr:hypothetical protein [Alcaligenes phenolicus]